MNAVKEIERRDRKIKNDKEIICSLKEEIEAMRQLLDCAAANIAILVSDAGGMRKISSNDVREALGKYKLTANRDEDGNYILKVEADNRE